MRGDPLPVFSEALFARLPVLEIHNCGDPCPGQLIFRQQLGLLVFHTLERMLQVSEKHIGVAKLTNHRRRQQLELFQLFQDDQQLPLLKLPVPATANELECLNHKLDLSDTAATQLDIVFEPLSAHLPANHGLHATQGLERAEIDVLAVHEGAQRLHEHLTRPLIARHHPGLDHGVPLPIPPLVLIVGFQSSKTQRQRATLAIRPETHVHPEHKTICRNLVQSLDQPLAKANEELLIIQ